MSSPFALVIAGRPLDTNFQPVDASKLMATIAQPAQVHEFTICLLQPVLPQVSFITSNLIIQLSGSDSVEE